MFTVGELSREKGLTTRTAALPPGKARRRPKQASLSRRYAPAGRHENGTRSAPAILVVDDEPLIRELLRLVLQQRGFRVLLAADGREALALYQAERSTIALVLLDVRMPGLDGPQTLDALRQVNLAVRACFLTGHAGDYTEEELLQRGALRVFAKPFHATELEAGLRQVIT